MRRNPKDSRKPGQGKKQRTPSFVCEVPLRATRRAIRAVLVRLGVGQQLYNVCLQTALARLKKLRASPEWARVCAQPNVTEAQRKRRARAFRRAVKRHGFTDEAIQHVAIKHFRHSKWMCDHLGSHEVQKVGTRAYLAVERILFGQARRVRFKTPERFRSLEGKCNNRGIMWKGDRLEWQGLVLPATIDPKDEVIAYSLKHRVKYVRIVLRRIRCRPLLYAQLVCEGKPCRKPKHTIGGSHVGLDFGPSTLALVGDDSAILTPLCEPPRLPKGANPPRLLRREHKQIRVLQRQLDRQRRANNPDNYLPDGQVKPGKKTWTTSKRERRTLERLAEIHRVEAATRKTYHGRLANYIVRIGRWIHREDHSVKALQRRFGKSINLYAPGLLLAILGRKAENAGGRVIDIPTGKAKLSQACHGCGAVHKKSLHERVHQCACGVTMQRDLYSAYLARWTDGEGRLHADQARAAWPGAEALLRAAWSRALQPAKGRPKPSTFGTLPLSRSQSGSLAQEGTPNAKALNGNVRGEAA